MTGWHTEGMIHRLASRRFSLPLATVLAFVAAACEPTLRDLSPQLSDATVTDADTDDFDSATSSDSLTDTSAGDDKWESACRGPFGGQRGTFSRVDGTWEPLDSDETYVWTRGVCTIDDVYDGAPEDDAPYPTTVVSLSCVDEHDLKSQTIAWAFHGIYLETLSPWKGTENVTVEFFSAWSVIEWGYDEHVKLVDGSGALILAGTMTDIAVHEEAGFHGAVVPSPWPEWQSTWANWIHPFSAFLDDSRCDDFEPPDSAVGVEGYGKIRRLAVAVSVGQQTVVSMEHTDDVSIVAADHTYRVVVGRTDFNENPCDHCPGSRVNFLIVRDSTRS